MTRMVLWTLFSIFTAFSSVSMAVSTDLKSDFKCGMTLTRNLISPTNFIGNGENQLIIPSLHNGQRGFYALDESGVKFHFLPPEKAVRKNDRFYYHRFALEDPKTKTKSHIVYSDIIADPDEAITVTMGAKDTRPFPLSIGVPVTDKDSLQTIQSRLSLSLKSIPPMIQSFVRTEAGDATEMNEQIRQALSQIFCSCGRVTGLKKEVEVLRLHPALVPFKVGTC